MKTSKFLRIFACASKRSEDAPAEIPAKGYHISYSTREARLRVNGRPARLNLPKRTVRLTVLHGESEHSSYELTRSRIHLGRLAEVLDERRRPVRRNDVVFLSPRKSRTPRYRSAHAHIEIDEASGEYRLFDDGSAYGTSVIHNGRACERAAGGRARLTDRSRRRNLRRPGKSSLRTGFELLREHSCR